MVFKKKEVEQINKVHIPDYDNEEVQAIKPPTPVAPQHKESDATISELTQAVVELYEEVEAIKTKLRNHKHTSDGVGYLPL